MRVTFVQIVVTLIGLHACMSMSRVAAALWVLDAGLGKPTVGIVLSLYSVGALSCALWAGNLVERYGFHRPAGMATAAAMAGLTLVALNQNIVTVGLAALLTGAAIVIIEISVQRSGARLAAGGVDLKRVFSAIAMATAMSSSLSPLIMGLLLDGVGFATAYVLLLALPVGVALLLWRIAPIVPGAASAARQPAAAWSLLRLPAVRRVLAVNLVLAATWDVHLFAVPVLGHERQMSASAIGLVLGCCSFGVFAVRVIITRWSEHLEEWRVLRTAMTVAMALLAAYAWLPGLAGMMAGSVVLGMCIGASQPMVLTALYKVTPPHQAGQALGLRILATNGLTAGMPMAYGALATVTGVAGPLGLIATALATVLFVVR